MTDFSSMPNPYDFANPILDPCLFIGRQDEIKDIDYYLNHATKASRPINLALIGDRASGKTSVLNMIEFHANKKGFCVVRINLDESDSASELNFFYKIFDSLFTKACELGIYGGLTGKTYNTYYDLVSTYEVPDENIFCPFIFPIRYAKAMSKNNINATLPDTNFQRDIISIQKELNKPIILLFDECDVLVKSRIHLQKLRNIFMNIANYMLVIAGTPALFPVIEDVFSPIIRQFKKIDIGPFTKVDETKNCIITPLEKNGIKDPTKMFEFSTLNDVHEIHDLTGGKPYEIQLICHFLFRRLQEGHTKQMKLTLDVLEDVLDELNKIKQMSVRRILNHVKSFETKQLEALGTLCMCNGGASFDQIWFSEYVFNGTKNWNIKSLKKQYENLLELGIIYLKDNNIYFNGDDFDRIYCKYLLRKHKIYVIFSEIPYGLFLGINMRKLLGDKFYEMESLLTSPMITTNKKSKLGIEHVFNIMSDPTDKDDVFQSDPTISIELYQACMTQQRKRQIRFAVLSLCSPWSTTHRMFLIDDTNELFLKPIKERTKIPMKRAEELNGSIHFEVYKFPRIPNNNLIEKLFLTDNVRVKTRINDFHSDLLYECYIEKQHDMNKALFHSNIMYKIKPTRASANNTAYLYLVKNNIQKAKYYLEEALEISGTIYDEAISIYNFGILRLFEKEYYEALSNIKQAINICLKSKAESFRCHCLIIPKYLVDKGLLATEQYFDIDLLDTANLAVSEIQKYIDAHTI